MVDAFIRETPMPANPTLPGSDETTQTPTEVAPPVACQTEARVREWIAANRQAFDDWNRDMAANGLPFDCYRQF
jgi:hypothetical protein